MTLDELIEKAAETAYNEWFKNGLTWKDSTNEPYKKRFREVALVVTDVILNTELSILGSIRKERKKQGKKFDVS